MDLDVSGGYGPKPVGWVGGVHPWGGLFSLHLSMAVALELLHSSHHLEKEIGLGYRGGHKCWLILPCILSGSISLGQTECGVTEGNHILACHP